MLVCIYLLFCLRQAASDCTKKEDGGTNLFHKSPGESVLLPCYCPDEKTSTEKLSWSYTKTTNGNQDKVISNEAESYRDRVKIFPTNFSLQITDLRNEDSGIYWCKIGGETTIYISLEVKGCSLSENKAAVPMFKKLSGESVLLDCSCTDLKETTEKVKWTTPNNKYHNFTELKQHYKDRVQMFSLTSPGNFSILISELTEDDAGSYSCWINENQYKNFTLTVKVCQLPKTEEQTFKKYPGESVLLPCSCSDPKTRPKTFKWEHVDSDGTEVSNQTPRYAGRVYMFNENQPSNLTLNISNLTEEDQGTYRCTINSKQSINISLSVIGCALSGTEQEKISAYPGHSVLLPCSCTDQKTRPKTFKWEHVDSGGTEVSNQTPNYTGRVHMFNENQSSNLTLLISNLTEEDQGTYRCTINSKQSINISLSVIGCALSGTEQQMISRYPGESVLLPCFCTDQKTRPKTFKWVHVDSGGTEVSNQTPNYTGRVHMFNENQSSNLTLHISNLTEEDQGTYRCTINSKQSINISLSVIGCTLTETEQHEISRSLGESVLLPCSCSDPKTRPKTIKWEHVDSGGTEVSNKTPNYAGRVHMFKENQPSNLSLRISKLTEKDKGTYRCIINNKQSINIILSAQTTAGFFIEFLQKYMIHIISIILLILLMLTALCIYRKYLNGSKKNRVEKTDRKQKDEDDIIYTTVVHGRGRKGSQQQDNVTYASVVHGKKNETSGDEDEVAYATVAAKKKKDRVHKKAEKDPTFSAIALEKVNKVEQEDQVVYASVAVTKKEERAHKKENASNLTAGSKSQQQSEEATVYASVKRNS